ncbi:cbb3-type cytochrome c oxidase subunit I, partial [Stenotrophomonas sp. 3diitr2024]|uniref:cbb3-type cytochrome c oxidase subunit I n=1 Tax=Stenotrophomonas sp. 3diitr2024 TaxID=3345115 RepID=UPI0035CBD8E4
MGGVAALARELGHSVSGSADTWDQPLRGNWNQLKQLKAKYPNLKVLISLGGNPMMYVNLVWAWGHPEVYILVLPAFGIFSEVTATFA